MKTLTKYSLPAVALCFALGASGVRAAAGAAQDPEAGTAPAPSPEEDRPKPAVTPTPVPAPADLTDSLQCDHLKRLVHLRLVALEKKQQAWTAAQSRDGGTTVTADGDAEDLPPRPFTDDDKRTLDRVGVLRSRLNDLCASQGRPESFYSLRAGGESFLDGTGIGTLYPILDFQWWTPIQLTRPRVTELMVAKEAMGASPETGLRGIRAPASDASLPSWGLVVPGDSLSEEAKARYTSLGLLFRREVTGAWERWGTDVREARENLRRAREELEENRKALKTLEGTKRQRAEESQRDVNVLAGVVATLAEAPKQRATGATAGVTSPETLKKLREMSSPAEAPGVAMNEAALAEVVEEAVTKVKAAKLRYAEVMGRSPDGEALEALERALVRLRPATLGPGFEANPLESLPDRAGPYLIPSTVAIRTQQLWGTVQVGTESLPKLQGYPVEVGQGTIDQSTLADKSSTRFTLRAGFTWQPVKFGNDEDPNTFGASLTLGTILGPLPDGDTSLQNRLFADAGLTLATNYRISQLDRDKAVNKAYGRIYLGYRWANYLKYQPVDPAKEGAWSDTDRLIGDFRIGWEKLASGSAKPFIYCIVDRSLGRRPRIHRDRVGIVVEVALDQAFKPLLGASGAPSGAGQ